jgi:hypothetical protein
MIFVAGKSWAHRQNAPNTACTGQVGGFARALADSTPKSESMV